VKRARGDERRARGRPREHDVDGRILDTCFTVLGEVGYSRMSVVDVAARAGVTRPTVYRRWPNKEDLAVAALDRAQSGIVQLPNSGRLLEDLREHLRSLADTLRRPNGMAIIGTMLAEEVSTPAPIEGFRARVVSPRRRLMREVLLRARDIGELDADADLDLLVDLGVGACYARCISGEDFGDDWPAHTAAAVVNAGRTGSRPA
jgi:AcrR family transcriptional regulator